MQHSVMSFEFLNFNKNFKTSNMLDFFLELEVLWSLLKMLFFDYECNTLWFAVLNNIAQSKFDFFKLNFLKIHIKFSVSIVFSPMIDV